MLTLAVLASAAYSQSKYGIDTVDKWDQTLESVRAGVTAVRSENVKKTKDIRGRTAEDDWKQWILAPESEARLTALREKVRAQATQSDYSGVSQTMNEAAPLVDAEAYKSTLLTTYWLVQSALVHHREIMEPLLARAPKDQAKAVRDRMKATEQRLADGVAPAMTLDPLAGAAEILKVRQAKTEAAADYNKTRAELVTALAGKSKEKPKARTRQAPCPAPGPGTSGSDKPKLGESDVSLDEVYPPAAVRDEVEGRVVVRVSVSPTGCMERAEVDTSSGADELDEAAMVWAERGTFLPAEKDGKAVAGTFTFAIAFKLPE